jgi:hypothetical protein
VYLFERDVAQRDGLGFFELHPAALLRPLKFAELNRQSRFRPTNDFHLIEEADAAAESSVS